MSAPASVETRGELTSCSPTSEWRSYGFSDTQKARTIKRKKRTTFQTPEEREAWEIRSEAVDRMIRDRTARIEAELRAKDPNYRDLDYWIEHVKAEREAEDAA